MSHKESLTWYFLLFPLFEDVRKECKYCEIPIKFFYTDLTRHKHASFKFLELENFSDLIIKYIQKNFKSEIEIKFHEFKGGDTSIIGFTLRKQNFDGKHVYHIAINGDKNRCRQRLAKCKELCQVLLIELLLFAQKDLDFFREFITCFPFFQAKAGELQYFIDNAINVKLKPLIDKIKPDDIYSEKEIIERLNTARLASSLDDNFNDLNLENIPLLASLQLLISVDQWRVMLLLEDEITLTGLRVSDFDFANGLLIPEGLLSKIKTDDYIGQVTTMHRLLNNDIHF